MWKYMVYVEPLVNIGIWSSLDTGVVYPQDET